MSVQSPRAAGAQSRSRTKERRKRPGNRWFSNGSVVVGGVIIAPYLTVLIVSLVWTLSDPNAIDPANRLAPTGAPGHLLGTDSLSHNVVNALLADAKNFAAVAADACGLSVVVDTVLGLTAAPFGRTTDELIMRAMDVYVSIPDAVITLVLAATIGSGIASTTFALLFFFTPAFIRMVRANALRTLTEDFPKVAELYGRSRPFIAVRHVLSNIFSILLVQASQYYAVAVLTEAGLSYLRVGMNRPKISWGMMLKEVQQTVGTGSPLAMRPGVVIMVTILGLNVLGDGVHDVLDPRLRGVDR